METLTANNRQVGGQYLNVGAEQYLVRGLGLVGNARDIGSVVLATRDGTLIYVRDVAEVKEAPSLRSGAVTKDGKEVVLGMALQRIGENAKGVVQAVKQKLAIAQQTLPKGVTLNPVYDRTELVDKAVKTAKNALIEGSILVAIILFLFLGEVRSAVVVMVENGFRLLSHQAGKAVDKTQVILEAAREVMNPVAFAILISIVVFLPLFSLTGLEGKMFKPMALTITFAMIGSLLLNMTLVPVLSALILKPKPEKDTFVVRWAKKLYLPLLDWALENKKKVIGGAVIGLLASFALIPFLGKEFMPTLQEGSIMFRVTSIPSTSLEESIRISQQLEGALK